MAAGWVPYRTRYLTGSGIIGTKAFVRRLCKRFKDPCLANWKTSPELPEGWMASTASNGSASRCRRPWIALNGTLASTRSSIRPLTLPTSRTRVPRFRCLVWPYGRTGQVGQLEGIVLPDDSDSVGCARPPATHQRNQLPQSGNCLSPHPSSSSDKTTVNPMRNPM